MELRSKILTGRKLGNKGATLTFFLSGGVMEGKTIFYSWQSDLPNNVNRGFIKKSIENVIKKINRSIEVQDANRPPELRIDHDTAGEPGSPDIFNTILRKIENCEIFIADLTFITSIELKKGKIKGLPNSNVLIELGYAFAKVGAERYIGIFNKSYGDPDCLPFNLKHIKFPIIYELAETSSNEQKKEIKKQFEKELENRILAVIGKESLLQKEEAQFTKQAKSDETPSFLRDGDVVCERPSRIHLDPEREVTWQEESHFYLRLIPHDSPKEFSPYQLRRLLSSGDEQINPFGPYSGRSFQVNQWGAVVYETISMGKMLVTINLTQVMRSGEIWAMDSSQLLQPKFIPPFTDQYIQALRQYLDFMKDRLMLKTPIKFIAGMVGVLKLPIKHDEKFRPKKSLSTLDGKCLLNNLFHVGIVHDFKESPKSLLIPFFIKVYEECGVETPDELLLEPSP
jgi:hypothetical protein